MHGINEEIRKIIEILAGEGLFLLIGQKSGRPIKFWRVSSFTEKDNSSFVPIYPKMPSHGARNKRSYGKIRKELRGVDEKDSSFSSLFILGVH